MEETFHNLIYKLWNTFNLRNILVISQTSRQWVKLLCTRCGHSRRMKRRQSILTINRHDECRFVQSVSLVDDQQHFVNYLSKERKLLYYTISSRPYKVGKISWKNISPVSSNLPRSFVRARSKMRDSSSIGTVVRVLRIVPVKLGITTESRV